MCIERVITCFLVGICPKLIEVGWAIVGGLQRFGGVTHGAKAFVSFLAHVRPHLKAVETSRFHRTFPRGGAVF